MEKKTRVIRICVLAGLLLFALLTALSALLRKEDGAVARLMALTHKTVEAPPQYGVFHIVFLSLCALLVAMAFVFHTRVTRERLDAIVFSAGCYFILMELYKQLYYHTVLGNGHYNFAVLPLQLCSYVLYFYPVIPLLGEGRVKDLLYRFVAFYQTAAGAIVMFCPLFYDELSRSVHTMLWHIAMVAFGVLILLCRGYGKRYFREVLAPIALFLTIFSFGLLLNVVLQPLTEHSVGELNLFYLSPYAETNNLIIGDVRDAFGWLPAVVTYAVLITAVCVNAVWITGRITILVKAGMRKRKEGENRVGNEENQAVGCSEDGK